jgi:hypothetical protein
LGSLYSHTAKQAVGPVFFTTLSLSRSSLLRLRRLAVLPLGIEVKLAMPVSAGVRLGGEARTTVV